MTSVLRATQLASDGRRSRAAPGRWLAALLVLGVAVAALLIGTGVALAHTELIQSDPPNGGLVATMPSQISLRFSEGIATIKVHVSDSAAQQYDSGAEIDSSDHRMAMISLRPGGNGTYTVTWNALSEDGHTSGGSFFFFVGDKLPDRSSLLALYQSSSPSSGPGLNLVEAAGRFVVLLSLMVLAGLPLAIVFIGRELISAASSWRIVRRILLVAALSLMVSSTVLALKQLLSGYSFSIHDIRTYMATGQGSAWQARWELATVATFGIALSARRWLVLTLSTLAAVGAQLSLSLVSHSHTLIGGFGAVFVDFVHLFFGATWGGGLILLAVVLPLASRGPASDEERLRLAAVGRRFAGMAILGAGLATAAGLVLAAWHVGTWKEFVSSVYGLSLLGKVALLAIALGLGALHRLVLVRRIEEGAPGAVSTFRRSVSIEALAVAGILALSAVITSAQTGAAAAAVDRQGPVHLSQTVLGTEIRLVATPADAGLNVFDATFLRHGNPTDEVGSPTILLGLPAEHIQLDEVPMTRVNTGGYTAVTPLTQPGAWTVRVGADVLGQYTAAQYRLPDPAEADAYTSDHGMALVLQLLAVAVAVATVGGLIAERVTGEKVGRAAKVAES